MNAHTLKEVLLDELDAKEDGDDVAIPAESRVTILVLYGDELLPVARVSTVRFGEHVVTVTGESEQFFVDTDCDFVVKAEDANRGNDGRPGFH